VPFTKQRLPGRRGLRAAVAGLCILVPAAGVSAASTATGGTSGTGRAGKAGDHESGYGPVIKHTRRGPTGYEVTFRCYAPQATRVQIGGEWYFERPSELPRLAVTPDYTAAENQSLYVEGVPT
jgi:hypothetical protein